MQGYDQVVASGLWGMLARMAALSFALLVVYLIHNLAMRHLKHETHQIFIASLEVTAVGILLAEYLLGKLANIAGTLHRAEQNQYTELHSTDLSLVFGVLAISLIIYVLAIKALQD